MDALYILTLTAILSQAAPAVDPVGERPRLERIAWAITRAVEHQDTFATWLPGEHALPFTGEPQDVKAATALAMVAISHHESRFRAEVEDCRVVGADHPSVTIFQLLGPFAFGPYTRRQLCRSTDRAAERAVAIFAHHGARCSTPQRWFHGYASGDCGRPSAAGLRQCAAWEWLARRAGMVVSCDVRMVRGRAAR